MKKFILPLMLLLLVGSILAVESAPSAVVGYFKKSIVEGSVQAISLPFAYADLGIDAVIGDQFADSDALQEINSGTSTIYYDGFGWFGDLETMNYGLAYYASRAQGNPNADYYIMGTVDPQPITVQIAGNGSVTAFGLNEAAPVTADEYLFGINPSDGDQIQEIDTGTSSVYYDGFGWFGDLEEIAPTYGYYYVTTAGSAGFEWTYPLPIAKNATPTPFSKNTK